MVGGRRWRRADDKRILLVATTLGYQIRSFGEAASKLGVRLVFASDRCDRLDDPWRDAAIPVRFHEEARSVAAVVSACGDDPPDGIVAVGDRPAVLAAHLAEAFGIPGHPPQAAAISRNKLLTRRVAAGGWPADSVVRIGLDRERRRRRWCATCRIPAVVKPLALSGQPRCGAGEQRRRVRRSDRAAADAAEGARRARRARRGTWPGARRVVHSRRRVCGRGTAQPRCRCRSLAIFDKPDPLDGPFFEETIYRTPSVATPDVQQRIVTAVSDAVRAIGLQHGPVHAECRVNEDGGLRPRGCRTAHRRHLLPRAAVSCRTLAGLRRSVARGAPAASRARRGRVGATHANREPLV